MDIIIKLLRKSFFYLLSFTLCMFVINFIFENWQRDIKLLFCLFCNFGLDLVAREKTNTQRSQEGYESRRR